MNAQYLWISCEKKTLQCAVCFSEVSFAIVWTQPDGADPRRWCPSGGNSCGPPNPGRSVSTGYNGSSRYLPLYFRWWHPAGGDSVLVGAWNY